MELGPQRLPLHRGLRPDGSRARRATPSTSSAGERAETVPSPMSGSGDSRRLRGRVLLARRECDGPYSGSTSSPRRCPLSSPRSLWSGIDGFFLAVDTESVGNVPRAVREASSAARPSTSYPGRSHRLPVLLDPDGRREARDDLLIGVVTATFVPLDASRPELERVRGRVPRPRSPILRRRRPPRITCFDIDYVNAMEAVMLALESVDGDLSDSGQAFLRGAGRGASRRAERPDPSSTIVARRSFRSTSLASRRTRRGISSSARSGRSTEVDQTYGGALRPEDRRRIEHNRHAGVGNPPPWAVGRLTQGGRDRPGEPGEAARAAPARRGAGRGGRAASEAPPPSPAPASPGPAPPQVPAIRQTDDEQAGILARREDALVTR